MGSKCYDLQNKPKTPVHCGFHLKKIKKGPSRDFVPESNLSNILILLYICSSNLKRDIHFRKNPENSISFESRTMFTTGFWGVNRRHELIKQSLIFGYLLGIKLVKPMTCMIFIKLIATELISQPLLTGSCQPINTRHSHQVILKFLF